MLLSEVALGEIHELKKATVSILRICGQILLICYIVEIFVSVNFHSFSCNMQAVFVFILP